MPNPHTSWPWMQVLKFGLKLKKKQAREKNKPPAIKTTSSSSSSSSTSKSSSAAPPTAVDDNWADEHDQVDQEENGNDFLTDEEVDNVKNKNTGLACNNDPNEETDDNVEIIDLHSQLDEFS